MEFTPIPLPTPGRVFRSAMPFAAFDPLGRIVEAYHREGVGTVVMLTGDAEAFARTGRDLRAFYAAEGFEVLQLPVRDFDLPTRADLDTLGDQILRRLGAGGNVAVHCFAGLGRAGLVLADLARRSMGLDGAEAIHWLRRHVPRAVQTREQADLVMGLVDGPGGDARQPAHEGG